jgi:hypothetical protein
MAVTAVGEELYYLHADGGQLIQIARRNLPSWEMLTAELSGHEFDAADR